MLKRILSGMLLRLIDPAEMQRHVQNYMVECAGAQCKLMPGSKFYPETVVVNRQNNPNAISIGAFSHIKGELMVMGYGGEILIGKYSYIGPHSHIWSGAKIIIGNHVLISHNVNIIDTNSHEIDAHKRAQDFKSLIEHGPSTMQNTIACSPIVVEDYAWINFNAIIQKGVVIGEGSIVAPGSVVTKNVEPYSLVGGNPAIFIKSLR